jgi:hypothetical protein
VPSPPPGWFFDTELALVFPALKFRLTNETGPNLLGLARGIPLEIGVPGPGTIHVPAVSLDPTVMPTFEVGYRLADSGGYFALSYSFLNTDGTGTVMGPVAPLDVRTRLGINWGDLDYGTTPYEFAPRYLLSWRIGARIADVFFDSRASRAGFSESASNDFFGAGIHGRMDLERQVAFVPGLSLFGRLDGVLFVGRVTQRFDVELPGVSDTSSIHRTQTVPYIDPQIGVTYVPPSLPSLKLTTGYVFQDYFNVGRLGISPQGVVSTSRGEMWSQGWFVRARWDF